MNRHDRLAWRGARTLADIGTLTAYWLRGDLTETPGHMGPPDPETIPHLEVLWVANFAGFVTTNSQSAGSRDGHTWNAWVDGFIAEEDFPKLLAVTSQDVRITRRCRGNVHGGHVRRSWRFWVPPCPARDETSFYCDRCPEAGDEIRAAWFVTIEDLEPGRNDRLWPALADFAGMEMAA